MDHWKVSVELVMKWFQQGEEKLIGSTCPAANSDLAQIASVMNKTRLSSSVQPSGR
jgi:hypothetical protein